MGVHSHLIIADASEASTVSSSDEPSGKWQGFFYRSLDRVKLATLWALVEGGTADNRFDERLDAIRAVPDSDQGPWVDIIPPQMLKSLADIAGMDEQEVDAIAEQWRRTDELQGWDALEVLELVRRIGDTAETAQLQNKGLLMWTCL